MNDIKEVIKRAAKFYGLDYDEKSDNPKVKLEDGSTKELTIEDIKNTFKLL